MQLRFYTASLLEQNGFFLESSLLYLNRSCPSLSTKTTVLDSSPFVDTHISIWWFSIMCANPKKGSIGEGGLPSWSFSMVSWHVHGNEQESPRKQYNRYSQVMLWKRDIQIQSAPVYHLSLPPTATKVLQCKQVTAMLPVLSKISSMLLDVPKFQNGYYTQFLIIYVSNILDTIYGSWSKTSQSKMYPACSSSRWSDV